MRYLQEIEVYIKVMIKVSKDEIMVITCHDDDWMDREVIWIGKNLRKVGNSWQVVGLAKVDKSGTLLQRVAERNPWIQVPMHNDMLEGDSKPTMSRGCFKI